MPQRISAQEIADKYGDGWLLAHDSFGEQYVADITSITASGNTLRVTCTVNRERSKSTLNHGEKLTLELAVSDEWDYSTFIELYQTGESPSSRPVRLMHGL